METEERIDQAGLGTSFQDPDALNSSDVLDSTQTGLAARTPFVISDDLVDQYRGAIHTTNDSLSLLDVTDEVDESDDIPDELNLQDDILSKVITNKVITNLENLLEGNFRFGSPNTITYDDISDFLEGTMSIEELVTTPIDPEIELLLDRLNPVWRLIKNNNPQADLSEDCITEKKQLHLSEIQAGKFKTGYANTDMYYDSNSDQYWVLRFKKETQEIRQNDFVVSHSQLTDEQMMYLCRVAVGQGQIDDFQFTEVLYTYENSSCHGPALILPDGRVQLFVDTFDTAGLHAGGEVYIERKLFQGR